MLRSSIKFRPTLVEVEEVVSTVDDVSQGAQNQWVNVIVEVNFFMIVLHREDAVHGNTNVYTELLHLHEKKHSCSQITAQSFSVTEPI